MIPNLNFWLLQSFDACEDFDLTKFLKWSASQWMRVRVCNKESEALSDGDRCPAIHFHASSRTQNSPEDPVGLYVVFLKRQAGETHLQKISEFDSWVHRCDVW